jgi:hypothetical protein
MSQSHSSGLEAPPEQELVSACRYFVYAITLHSEIPLVLPTQGHGELGQIELRVAPASHFSVVARSLPAYPDSDLFCQSTFLPDGSTYVRWEGVGEFLISPGGCRIIGRQHDAANEESYQV